VSSNLSASIQKLRESASKLNQLTDQANLTVQTVEHLLRDECKVGTPASIRLNELPKNSGLVNVTLSESQGDFLSFCKVGSNFRIAVVKKTPNEDTVTPWSDCPRDLKLETIRKLPDLVSKLIAEIDKRINDAEAALADVSGILNSETDHLSTKSKRESVKSKRGKITLSDLMDKGE
jgi:hypothetical protein